jgi:hypothetical protein
VRRRLEGRRRFFGHERDEVFRLIPQNNVYALMALASFGASLLTARLTVRILKGEMPGGALWVLYLRMLLGFLFAAAIVFGYKSFLPPGP